MLRSAQGRVALLLIFASLGFMLVGGLLPSAAAMGGSRSQTGPYAQPGFTTVTSSSTGTNSHIPNVIQGDYVVVLVGFVGNGQSVTSVSDTQGTSFTQTGRSHTNEDAEIWCGKYTAASGTDSVTVQSSASATYVFTVYILGGLFSCSGATVEVGSGPSPSSTSATMSVASFTPTTGYACIGIGDENAGTSGVTYTQANPFAADNGGPSSPNEVSFNTDQYAVTILRGAWNSNDGATTAAITPSASSSPYAWDEVVACYATYSAGNDAYNSGIRGGGRSATNTPNEGVNPLLKGDYALQFTAVEGTSYTVTSVTDNSGDTGTWSKVAQSNTRDDAEIWMTQATATTGSSGFQVTSTLTGTAADSVVLGWDIGAITSTTPEVWTNSGTSSTIALSSSVTPDADDLCIEAASINTGSSATPGFTVASNQPFQDVGVNTIAYGNLWEPVVMRADWPAGVPTNAAISVSGTSSPTWDLVVVCFPGTVVVPVTCTMGNTGSAEATLVLSESSGNSLTPTTLTCNGNQNLVTVDPSVTLTATEPADGTSTRYRFSGGTLSVTDAVCAGSANGECAAWSFTDYEQLLNTYQASPTSPRTWDAALSIAVTGTQTGTAVTLCTIATSNGGGSASCQAYSDYDTQATVTTPLVVSTVEQWVATTANTFTDTTGGNTHTVIYSDRYSFGVSDGFTFSESASRSLALPRQIGPDSYASSDSASQNLAFGRQASDGYPVSDLVSGALALLRSQSDEFGWTDSVASNLLLARALDDTYTFMDSVGTILAFSRAVADMVASAESASRSLALTQAASDAFSLADGAARQLNLTRLPSDLVSFADSLSQQLGLTRATGDSFGFTDSPLSNGALVRAAGDAYSFSDSVVRSLGLQAVVSDSYGFLGGVEGAVTLSRTAVDSFVASDLLTGLSSMTRSVSDSLPSSEVLSRSLALLRALVDHTTFGETLASLTVNLERITINVADNFPFSDAPTRLLFLERLVADSASWVAGVQRQLSLLRGVVDGFLVQGVASRLVTLFATVTDLIKVVLSAIANEISAATSSTSANTSSSAFTTSTTSTTTTTTTTSVPSRGPFVVIEGSFLVVSAIILLALLFLVRRRRRNQPTT